MSNSPDGDPQLALETSGLVKAFGAQRALDGVSLKVARGSIFGLLGPNGAGKTTLVRLLATLLRPDAGWARVLGRDVVREPNEVRRRISLTGQFASVDEDLSGQENLILLARLLGLSRARAKERTLELLRAFELLQASQRQVKAYSGGMRRRLDIAASIIVTPELLFLDEPTTGLDPRSRGQVWEVIRALVQAGTTVLLTTQYLDEADHLADRIAVIDRGKLIAEGSSAELKASVAAGVLHVRLRNPAQREQARLLLGKRLGVPVNLEADATSLVAQVSDPGRAAVALSELGAANIGISDFSLGQPSLDEVFFALTGHPTDAAGEDGGPAAGAGQRSMR
jgi:daunorubicin/doxorubicin transport system ATP-binding protein